jgi:hypothetical protein
MDILVQIYLLYNIVHKISVIKRYITYRVVRAHKGSICNEDPGTALRVGADRWR